MKKYLETYYNYFGIQECDPVYDEFEMIVNNRMVIADNVHHISHGCNKTDDINNLMALSYDNHQLSHSEQLNRYYLRDIHIEFMNNHPY